MITLGSLFSGIGGLELGLECALRDGGFDVQTTWQCEQDEWCRGVLARHWPAAIRYDDVRGVGADAPRVDVLCGGFPCQDISVCGRGAGLAGARSGLWFEFARIIRELRPRVVVVENVAALLSRGGDRVLADLAAAGYDALWETVRAADVGAPHKRERLFVVAWRVADTVGVAAERRGVRGDVGGARGAAKAEAQQWQRRGDAPRGGCAALADAYRERCKIHGERGLFDNIRPTQRDDPNGRDCADVALADAGSCRSSRPRENKRPGGAASRRDRKATQFGDAPDRIAQPGVGRGADGVPCGLDRLWPAGRGEPQHPWEPPRTTTERGAPGVRARRLRALGNAVVPQVAYAVGAMVVEVLRSGGAA